MFYGVELDIMDAEGTVDLSSARWSARTWLLPATTPCAHARRHARGEHPRLYLRAMANPFVNIIGHPDDGCIPIDFQQLVRGASARGEDDRGQRELRADRALPPGYRRQHPHILELCPPLRASVVLGTDAHP